MTLCGFIFIFGTAIVEDFIFILFFKSNQKGILGGCGHSDKD